VVREEVQVSSGGFSAEGLSSRAENKVVVSWILVGGSGNNPLPSSFKVLESSFGGSKGVRFLLAVS
jgi:hypothetical protein